MRSWVLGRHRLRVFGNMIWRKFFWLPWILLAMSVRLRNLEQPAKGSETPA